MRKLYGWRCFLPFMCLAALVAVVILGTEQHGALHEGFRGFMACSFGSCIVVTVWCATSMIAEVSVLAGDKLHWAQRTSDNLVTGSYLLFVVSVICWLADNYFCSTLRMLPWGLPYPQLHMWWHILSGMAIAGLLVFFQLHDE